MRFAHVKTDGNPVARLVAVDGENGRFVDELFPGAPRTLDELIGGGEELLDRVREASAA